MQTIKIKDLLPISFTIIIATLHKLICEKYSELSNNDWCPSTNDYFYYIAAKLIAAYKKCGRKVSSLMQKSYLNNIISPPGSPTRIVKKKCSPKNKTSFKEFVGVNMLKKGYAFRKIIL